MTSMLHRCLPSVAALALALLLTPSTAFAQKPVPRAADIAGRAPAAKRLLSSIGHWAASTESGVFYLQFRANGSYTYTHIDQDKVIRAQHAGHFDVRTARLGDERWPGVAAQGLDAKKNRGFELLLEPSAVEVQASDPQGLPDDNPGEYRLTLTLAGDAGPTPTLIILSTTLPPDSAFGKLTFTPGP